MYDTKDDNPESNKIDIMTYINKDKLNLINDSFSKLGNSLTLDQFIQVMLHYSEVKSQEEDIEFVENIIETFNQIDVNGNGAILWDEFSNFIVESGGTKVKKNFTNVIRNYHLCDTAKDRHKHDNDISKIYFFDAIKHLLVIECESKKIIIYNYLTGGLITSYNAHNGSVLAAEYLTGQDLVCSTGSDNCLLFWDPIHNYRLVNKIPTRETQIVIRWYRASNYLITGGFDQVINIYKNLEFNDGKLRNPINLISLKKMHSEILTDILVLRRHKMLIVGDIKGVISIWNLQTLDFKDKLKDQKYKHKKGIVSLDCVEERNWLLSCGVEHFIIIWDLVVGKHVGILQGHSTSLIGVRILKGTDQIITGDVGGIFKVWDSRDLNLVQTFSIPNVQNKKAHSFTVTNKHKKKIIIGADKVYYFDYEESQEGNLADTYVCTDIIYNDIFSIFITAHMNCIKIWDATNGQLTQKYKSPTKSEISCIKLERRKRKLFVGDIEGETLSINILNGTQMKEFTSHKKYVSALDYYNEGKKFISASWDGTIKIHDDDSPDEKGLQLFEFSHNVPGKVNSCNSMDFSEELKILACGYDNGAVTLINMKSLSSEGTLSDHKKITVCKFLEDYPTLIVCDQEGDIHFWTIALTKPKKIMKDYQFKNYSINDNNTKENFPIKCFCFEKKNNILFMGDETGYVKVYNISEYIKYLKLMLPCSKIEYSSNYEKDSKKELTKELQELKDKLLSLEKYNPLDPNSPQIEINLTDLISIKNSMDIKPVFVKEWIAHKNGISAVCCYHDPVMYITAGHDLKIHIWDENFELIGNLMNSTDPNWKVKIDVESKKMREKEFAKKKYEELKNLDFNSLFEGETKLPKLIEYTNYDLSN